MKARSFPTSSPPTTRSRPAARTDRDARSCAAARTRVKNRLADHLYGNVPGGDAHRIMKRLFKYEEHLFTFLDDLAVPFDNNRAEREIRPAVLAKPSPNRPDG